MQRSHPRVRVLAAAVLAVAALNLTDMSGASGAAPDPEGWSMGGVDLQNSRTNSVQKTLSPSNASRLATKWTTQTHGDVSATPAVVGGFVYFPDWGGYLDKVDAKTGAVVWARKLSSYGFNDDPALFARSSPAVVGNTLYLGDQAGYTGTPRPAHVFAVDTRTGDLLWATVINENPFSIVTQSPVVTGGVVYVGTASAEEADAAFIPGYVCCTFRGSFSALDAKTGKELWRTYTVPLGYSGGAVWGSTPAIDTKSKTVYITTGNNYDVPDAAKQCQLNGGTPAECLDPADHIDSIMALDPSTGAIKWATGVQGFDDWIVSCIPGLPANPNCPPSPGPDFDFGSGANLFTAVIDGKKVDLVGAGQKSGTYWALNAATGQIVWSTTAGPGSTLGGIEWGTAYDGKRIYVAEANFGFLPYDHNPALPPVGSFAALDPATGRILWQTADPSGSFDTGAVSASNGLMFAASMSGHMYVLDGATGQILKDFAGAGSSNAGPAIDNAGTVYWGNGYARFGVGSTTFYAFSVDGR
jgi:polyvinyl alcohol dehydrogenase (cytochrome)